LLLRALLAIAIAAATGCTDWDAYTRCHGGRCGDAGAASDAAGGDGGGAICSGNLIENPGFEDGQSGWQPDDGASTLEQVAGGHESGFALEVCGSEAAGYGVSASSANVSEATEGDQYRLRGWLRSDAVESQNVRLLLREKTAGGAFVQLEFFNLEPASDWADGTTTVLTVGTSGNAVAVSVVEEGPDSAGRCFQLDDLCLEKLD
jgi:hypothetical protein